MIFHSEIDEIVVDVLISFDYQIEHIDLRNELFVRKMLISDFHNPKYKNLTDTQLLLAIKKISKIIFNDIDKYDEYIRIRKTSF